MILRIIFQQMFSDKNYTYNGNAAEEFNSNFNQLFAYVKRLVRYDHFSLKNQLHIYADNM